MRNLGKFEDALECLKESLNMRIELFGEEHPKVATSYNYMAWDLDELGRSDEALKINLKAY
jgi:hypothetical protein